MAISPNAPIRCLVPSKFVTVVVFATLLAGAGVVVLAAGAGKPAGAPKAAPPPAVAGPAIDRFGDPLPPGAITRLGTLRFHADNIITQPIVLRGSREVAFPAGVAVVVMNLDTGKTIRRITRTANAGDNANAITALALYRF